MDDTADGILSGPEILPNTAPGILEDMTLWLDQLKALDDGDVHVDDIPGTGT